MHACNCVKYIFAIHKCDGKSRILVHVSLNPVEVFFDFGVDSWEVGASALHAERSDADNGATAGDVFGHRTAGITGTSVDATGAGAQLSIVDLDGRRTVVRGLTRRQRRQW